MLKVVQFSMRMAPMMCAPWSLILTLFWSFRDILVRIVSIEPIMLGLLRF